jgi:hypothetical protein
MDPPSVAASVEVLEVDPRLPSKDELRRIVSRARELRNDREEPQINTLMVARLTAISEFYDELDLTCSNLHSLQVYNVMDMPRGFQFLNNPEKLDIPCSVCGGTDAHAYCTRCYNHFICNSECASTKCKSGSCIEREPRKCAVCGALAHFQCSIDCDQVSYCGEDCQSEHWKLHKKECKLRRSKK